MANLSEQADMDNTTGEPGRARKKPRRTAESLAAEVAFRKLLEDAGAELLEPEYLGVTKRHRIRCAAGHECAPRPVEARRHGTICVTCAGRDTRVVEAAFRARLAELGCTPLFEKYLGRNRPHAVLCANGHECRPRPGGLKLGRGVCRVCAGLDHATAEAAFRDAIKKMGAELLGEPGNAHTKVHCRCAAGHDCYPTPAAVQHGRGICTTCANKNPVALEARFRAQLAELGATPLFDKYLGSERGHFARCAAGHECWPRPSGIRDGEGPCFTCGGKDPRAAEAAFCARLAELGAELLEPYVNGKTPVLVRCPAGHECRPHPGPVAAGGGICRTCSKSDPIVAEAQFRERLAELGAELLVPYVNSVTKHHVRCIAGHDLYLRPGVVQSSRHLRGICVTCAGKAPGTAEDTFRARLAELGAVLLEPRWLGTHRRHAVQCPQGHLCHPLPSNVSQGCGICRFCAAGNWDAFYVVTGPPGLKFGITRGRGRHRLGVHARRGYTNVMRFVNDLPGTVAIETENAVKSALALAREKPLEGREYFDISCLSLVLDVADSWLGIAEAATA